MLQDDESLALALRGGLRGRFQGTFNQLENAVEVLDERSTGSWPTCAAWVTTPPMLPRPPYCRCCVCPPPWNC